LTIYKAIVCDAYGTLFNLDESLISNLEIDNAIDILAYARTKQLAYTWQYSLMQAYIPFDSITQMAIEDGCRISGNHPEDAGKLIKLYTEPTVFSDVQSALKKLSEKSAPLFILSNGTRKMIDAGMHKNNLSHLIDGVFSADQIKRYKPDPRVYAMVTSHLNCRPEEVLFISSNAWDAVGAEEYGYEVLWLNRAHNYREQYCRRNRIREIFSLSDVTDIIG